MPESYPNGPGFPWKFLGQQGRHGSTLAIPVNPEQAPLNVVGSLVQSPKLSLRVKAFDMAAAAKVLGIIKL